MEQFSREKLQKEQSAAALAQMLQGQQNQAKLAQQAKEREGEESLGALNLFLEGQPEVADRLGRRTEGPMPEGVAGPGAPVYNPYVAKGAGAATLADFVKGEIAHASQEQRAAAQQNAELRNMLLKAQFERENLGVTEGGKDRRLRVTEGGQDRRLGVTEEGKDYRFVLGEKGKTARSTEMAKAIAGESTLRTQMGQMDNYIKGLQAQATAAQLEAFISKDPAKKLAAEQKLRDITAELYSAQEQYKSMLGPRTPGVTQPVAPATPPVPRQIENWRRGSDGRLVPIR
jgi:hypothetical protein